MSHPFRSFGHVPTLGSNPVKGASEKDVKAAQVAIMGVLRAIDADEIGPTRVLADGKLAWVNRFLEEMRGFRLVDRGHADILWSYFDATHARRFPGMTPAQVLDNWEEASPMTAAEARATIEHTSASTEEGRRATYGKDSYDMENAVRNAIDAIPDDQLVPQAPAVH